MKTMSTVLGALLVLMVSNVPAQAVPESIISGGEAGAAVRVTDVASSDGTVSGVVVNDSNALARNIHLLIRHAWLWNNERHPGPDSPGQADFYTVPVAIPPHGSVTFHYQGPPLPERVDGRFVTRIQVVSFTQVGP